MKFDYTKQPIHPGTQIWFAAQDDNGITIKAGRIIGQKDNDDCASDLISAEICGEKTGDYLVESSDKDDGRLFLNRDEIFLSLKECLKEYNLIKFCEINLGDGVKVRDCAIATDIEEAIKTLKEKYPEATYIEEVK